MRHEGRCGAEGQVHLAAQQVLQRRARALVGHVHHLHAGLLLQHGTRHMLQRAVARRGIVELAGVGLGVAHQLGQRLHRQLGAHDDDLRCRQHIGHRGKVALLPALGLGQVGRDDVVARVLHQQRVAVGIGTLDQIGGDGAVAAALVVHHHRLPDHRRQRLCGHAAGQIGGATRGCGHDHQHGFAGIAALGHGRGTGKAGRGSGRREQKMKALTLNSHVCLLIGMGTCANKGGQRASVLARHHA